MKIGIVPDVHGREFWKKIKNVPDLDWIIFLGDYLDPYEGVTPQQALDNFKEIVEFAKSDSRVRLLLGNHDGQYLGWSKTRSRYCKDIAESALEVYHSYDMFLLACQIENVLFTHAGVSQTWLEQCDLDWTASDVCRKLNEMLREWKSDSPSANIPSLYAFEENPAFATVGFSRGGFAPSGGPTWADLTEISSNPAFTNDLIQIFGHTQLKDTGNVIHRDNWYMCDSRSIFIWDGQSVNKIEDKSTTISE